MHPVPTSNKMILQPGTQLYIFLPLSRTMYAEVEGCDVLVLQGKPFLINSLFFFQVPRRAEWICLTLCMLITVFLSPKPNSVGGNHLRLYTET